MHTNLELTERQHQVLRYIKQHIRELGYPPSIRDICTHVKIKSTSTVHNYLNSLESKGLIHRDRKLTRAIEVKDQAAETIKYAFPVPIVQHIQNGLPMLSTDDIEEYFPYPKTLIDTESAFFIRIKTDSQSDLGFYTGDLVLVQKQNQLSTGDIVISPVHQDQRYDGIRFWVFNASPTQSVTDVYSLIEDSSVLGKVIGLVRMY